MHSQIELLLTKKLGDTGKKIHAARSRNDQVLVDIKLFLRSEIEKTVHGANALFDLLITQSENTKVICCPAIRTCNWLCHPHLVYGLVLMQKAFRMT